MDFQWRTWTIFISSLKILFGRPGLAGRVTGSMIVVCCSQYWLVTESKLKDLDGEASAHMLCLVCLRRFAVNLGEEVQLRLSEFGIVRCARLLIG
jgi:hypothetical protein